MTHCLFRSQSRGAIVVILSLLLSIPAVAAEYPVRWENSAVFSGLKDLKDASKAMDVPVTTNDPQGLVLTGKEASEQRKRVKTCRQYFAALKAGFAAYTTFDRTEESFFIMRCEPLSFLQRAKPAKESHLRHYAFTSASFADLPPSLGGLGGDSSYNDKLQLALKSGTSWRGFAPDYKVKSVNPRELTVTGGGESITFDILAWGDINGDGIDDMLVFTASYATEGSMRAYQTFVLTRKASEKLFRVVGELRGGELDLKGGTLDISYAGCQWEEVDADRSAFRKLYDKGKFPDALQILSKTKERCFAGLSSERKVWLLSDLTLAAVRCSKKDLCQSLVAEAKSLEAYAWEGSAARAMKHNEKLCEGLR